jgi:CHAT domain-containing protein
MKRCSLVEPARRRIEFRLRRAAFVIWIAFPFLFFSWTCHPSMAQRPDGISATTADTSTVRLAVAHQHVGSYCLGHLHINANEVWYEVVKPARYQDHAFRVQRSQIAVRQWILLGQPQNATEIKSGRTTYHFWLLGDQDLAHTPSVELQQPVAMPFQYLISAIQRGGNPPETANPKPATLPPPVWLGGGNASATSGIDQSGLVAQNRPQANLAQADPNQLLADALRAMEAYRLKYRQTGDTSDLAGRILTARAEALTAHQTFQSRGDSIKAAQSLIAVADIDRMLLVQNEPDYQVKQAAIKEKYANALALAGSDREMKFKALLGLSLADSNSKDYAAAADHLSQAIDLAAPANNKEELFDAYERAAEAERQRGNLAAASDYLDRAWNIIGDVKDPFLLWLAYTDRADIYQNRASQCNYQHDYALCKKAFELSLDDTQKAFQIAQQAGLSFLARQSQQDLADRKLQAGSQVPLAATFAELTKADLGITKASQVILTPRFAAGANPALAALIGNLEKQYLTVPISPFDVTKAYLDGELAESEGKDDAALQSYSRAVALLNSDRRKLGDVQGTSSVLSDQIEVYYAAALQHLDRKQYSQAFELIERSRARSTAELLASRQLAFRTPELQDLFSQSVGLKAQIAKAQNSLFDASALQKNDSPQVKDLQTKVDALEAEEGALETKIRQRAPKLADLVDRPPVSLAAAQAAARQGNYDVLYYLTLGSGTVIWHIGADSVHVLKVYYTRDTLSGRVAALRSNLTDPNSTFADRTAAELFLVLVNPVLQYVRTSHLVIVPHEDLVNLPFQVLKNPQDGSFLGERFQISYAPSATVLAGLGRPPDFAHGRLLALADPGITDAVAEVKAIGNLYPGRGNIVTDTLASKQSLKSWLPGYNLLHISVHGVFDANNPLLSHVNLRPAQGDNGQLTAAEMFGLNLPEHSLVVLSACETGRLNATHGNEVQGIVPALLFAGASTLVLSSWKVNAASTALWMETFYREAQTKAPSEAARLALIAVKGKTAFQHPFYWAPYLLTGQ